MYSGAKEKKDRWRLISYLLLVLFSLYAVGSMFLAVQEYHQQQVQSIDTSRGKWRQVLELRVNSAVATATGGLEACQAGAEGVALCQEFSLRELLKKQIRNLSLPAGEELQVKYIRDYLGGQGYAKLVVDGSHEGDVLNSRRADVHQQSPLQQELDEVRTYGQSIYDSWFGGTSAGGRYNVAKGVADLRWIITASVSHRKIDEDSRPLLQEAQKRFYGSFFKSLLVLLSAFVCIAALLLGRRPIAQEPVTEELGEKTTAEQEERRRLEEVKAKLADVEQRLDEEHQLVTELLNCADNVALCVTSFEGQEHAIVLASAGAASILGYRREEMKQLQITRLLPHEIGDELAGIAGKTVESGKAFSGEIVLISKMGLPVPFAYSSHPRYHSGEVRGRIIIAFDITPLQQLRKQLQIKARRLGEIQKLEAIGTLAGGIANYFNNALSSIVGYTELVKEQLPENSQVGEDLEQVLQASTRAASLVKQLLAFSRHKKSKSIAFDPAIVVNEALKMVRSILPVTISIESEVGGGGQNIYADSTQFHQMFMTLCTRGYESMVLHSGVLSVALRPITEDQLPETGNLEGQSFIELVVQLSAESHHMKNVSVFHQDQQSETSLQVSSMGLKEVENFVKGCGGAFWGDETGKTRVEYHVVFPSTEDYRNQALGTRGDEVILSGSEKVLFVDDEVDITRMVHTMLSQLGYEVACCTTAHQALELFAQDGNGFDLVITDLTMPEMTGIELAHEIRQRSNSVPIILCTGYSAKISEKNWMRHGVNRFIMKPFRKREIAFLIREILDSSGDDKDS